MEIRRKIENEVEFYTVELTGQSGMSQSGLALLAGVSRTALQDLEKTLATSAPSKYLESFVGKALTLATSEPSIDGNLIGNLKIYKSAYCASVLQHYADPEIVLTGLAKDERPIQKAIATRSCFTFMKMGIDSWIQNITGWDVRSKVPLPYTNVYPTRLRHIRDHVIADDLWCIFNEPVAAQLLLLVEEDWRVPVNQYDLLDGSIGIRWRDYREGKEWAGKKGVYTHNYRDQRGSRPSAAFSYDELSYFKQWLRDEYIPNWLPKYLIGKYGRQTTRLIYTENGLLTNEIIKLTDTSKLRSKGLQDDTEKLDQFLASRQLLDEKLLGE
jgi:DNA-binding XRE family transcriptional regulator